MLERAGGPRSSRAASPRRCASLARSACFCLEDGGRSGTTRSARPTRITARPRARPRADRGFRASPDASPNAPDASATTRVDPRRAAQRLRGARDQRQSDLRPPPARMVITKPRTCRTRSTRASSPSGTRACLALGDAARLRACLDGARAAARRPQNAASTCRMSVPQQPPRIGRAGSCERRATYALGEIAGSPSSRSAAARRARRGWASTRWRARPRMRRATARPLRARRRGARDASS